MKQLLAITVLTIAILLSLPSSSSAQFPRTISFQGRIESQRGPAGQSESHTIYAMLFDRADATEPVYWEEHRGVEVVDGVFSILIGSIEKIPDEIDFTRQYWLGIYIDEMTPNGPRIPLSTAPYSFASQTAVSLSRNSTNGVHTINGAHGPITLRGEGGVNVRMEANVLTISTQPIRDSASSTPAELKLPFAGTSNDSSDAFSVTNSGSGAAAHFATTDSNNSSPTLSVVTEGTGSAAELHVDNAASDADALTVTTDGTGRAVSATSRTIAIEGIATSDAAGTGVRGENKGSGYGVVGSTKSAGTTAGVLGENLGSGIGTKGVSESGIGVYAEALGTSGATTGLVATSHSAGGTAISASNDGGGTALVARSNGGDLARFETPKGVVASIDRDGNLTATNLPGVAFAQARKSLIEIYPGKFALVDDITITVPARGFLSITAFSQYSLQSARGAITIDLDLVNVDRGTVIASAHESENGTYGGANATGNLSLTWVIPVEAGTIRLQTGNRVTGNCRAYVKEHALQAIYLPVGY